MRLLLKLKSAFIWYQQLIRSIWLQRIFSLLVLTTGTVLFLLFFLFLISWSLSGDSIPDWRGFD
ncbi:MAG: hypothetical protein ACNS62_14805 [Candidatus Cyclobacteriaceae bacterium M3_2C_046]